LYSVSSLASLAASLTEGPGDATVVCRDFADQECWVTVHVGP